MIAPVRPFTITGEPGKPIASAPLSLEAMGVEAGSINLTASDIDTFNFGTRKTVTMVNFPVPESGQIITVSDATGRRLFTGTAQIRPRLEGGRLRGYQASVSGPMKWAKDTPVETMVADETGAPSLQL